MKDNQLHAMLRRLFQHTQSMRKYQRNLKDMNTNSRFLQKKWQMISSSALVV